ncbi:ultraviolet-B receptor UVR8 [Aricia agestis]|uniref:ultraviolet-B receptor UVR8 n=1 Tax=Aricia agestis TaxID=91739 RepID=UPI001C202220|nr:ultraviolet-B receptor UVR8 [Aricia agestis]
MMWTWGANSHGQLGLGYVSEQVDKPTKITSTLWNGVSKISCGGGHSLLIDNEGKLFSCGWNSKKQTGHPEEKYKFERTWCLSGIKFTNVACGWDFSCGITDDNFMFVWGSNSHGQLGLPKEHFQESLKPIKLQVKACDVSMGLRHSALLSCKGDVWTTGCGKHGQLGLGNNVLESDRFQKISSLCNITHIACGQNHTVAWRSSDRSLFVWGDNKHGQLLLSSDKYRKIFKPEKIDIDAKSNVKKLLSGWTNVLLWLADGSLLTWGRNNYGQLGTDTPFIGTLINIKLPDRRQAKDVVLGSEHTVCLANDNTLWAWGWNEHANTGVDSADCVFQPTLVPLENLTNIRAIYSGAAHNFLVVNENEVKCE